MDDYLQINFHSYARQMNMKTVEYAFRMVHIDNIQHILKYGIVKKTSVNADPNYVAIGDMQIIAKRTKKTTPDGTPLDDFIPFYFGPRPPMLLVIQSGWNGVVKRSPEEIVYCTVKLSDIMASDIDCIFTDGHAISANTIFYTKAQLANIGEYINHEDVFAERWSAGEYGDEAKRKKDAELLFMDEIPVQYINSFVVYNQNAKQKLISKGVNQPIYVASQYYY